MKQKFNWLWIKKQAKTCEAAAELLALAKEVECKPHHFSGRRGILEWIDEVEGTNFHKNLVDELHRYFFFELNVSRFKYNSSKNKSGPRAMVIKKDCSNSKRKGF